MELKTFRVNNTICQYIRTDKFKTRVISVRFFSDFVKEEAAARHVMFSMLRAKNDMCPTRKAQSRHLEFLYDALWLGSSSKLGTKHVNTLSLVVIDDRYTLEKTLFKDALAFIKAAIFNPEFDAALLEEEKRFLKDLIKSEYADKVRFANKRFVRQLMHNHPYRGSARGTLEDIDALTLADIKKQYRDMLERNRIFIGVVGDLDVEATHRDICEALPLTGQNDAGALIYRHRFDPMQTLHESQKSEQTRLFSSFASDVYYRDKDYLVMEAMNNLLGEGSDSLLFKSIREEAGMAYDIASGYSAFTGLVHVSAGVSLDNVSEVVRRIEAGLTTVQSGMFSDELLSLAKKTLISGYKQSYDSAGNLSQKALRSALFDIPFREDRLLERIEGIRTEDIARVAKRLRPILTFTIGGDVL